MRAAENSQRGQEGGVRRSLSRIDGFHQDDDECRRGGYLMMLFTRCEEIDMVTCYLNFRKAGEGSRGQHREFGTHVNCVRCITARLDQ